MKLLYLTPKINAEGGLERVLCLKANYLTNHFNHDVTIVTQNNGNDHPFYAIDDKIKLVDIDLSGNRVQFVSKYLKEIKRIIETINPDVIVIVDSIYKAFLVSLVAKNKRLIYECHNSIYVQQSQQNTKWISKFTIGFNRFGAKRMTNFVALSKDSLNEWQLPNGVIIPNPNWLITDSKADLKSKKILMIARHSYEKGLDRFFSIWKEVVKRHPDWQVEIVGKEVEHSDYKKTVDAMGISATVIFTKPTQQIETKYLESSIYVMTSRYEAFPMVLIEAMSCGLPVIAYDCPCGPRAIINNENGFLIENGNQDQFIIQLEKLMYSYELREKIGTNAKESVKNYEIDSIMKQWNDLLVDQRVHK